MSETKNININLFQKYLTVWVIICMIIGILIGKYLPFIPEYLNKFEYANVSIPIAVLIWVMIYPMIMKVDFKSVKDISKNPSGLIITWITNWLIKPFTMYGICYIFFYIIFKVWIPEYLAGAVLLGTAPCTAMIFVWTTLTKGNATYIVVQVATNDLIILIAFVPIVSLLLGMSNITVPFDTLFLSIVLFIVIPLVFGIYTRYIVCKKKGKEYFESKFLKNLMVLQH